MSVGSGCARATQSAHPEPPSSPSLTRRLRVHTHGRVGWLKGHPRVLLKAERVEPAEPGSTLADIRAFSSAPFRFLGPCRATLRPHSGGPQHSSPLRQKLGRLLAGFFFYKKKQSAQTQTPKNQIFRRLLCALTDSGQRPTSRAPLFGLRLGHGTLACSE